VTTPRVITRRIVLRLDPAEPRDGALASVMQLAAAFRAELAARMISDTRLAGALVFADLPGQAGLAQNIETQLRRTEASLRRALAETAAGAGANWSFEVVHCAGVLARECAMASDDLVAIEVPRVAVAAAEWRDEVADALVHVRGVLLVPAQSRTHGPVVAIIGDSNGASSLLDEGGQIAEALGVPFKRLAHDARIGSADQERREAADIATAVRRLGASLAVIDAANPIVTEFLARPRLLREIAAPLLLLKAAG
jgi:hypothetical protein